MSEHMAVQPVDAVEVMVLVDNFMDALLPSSPIVRRASVRADSFEREQLIAEHGFSVMLTVYRNGHKESLLYDTGLGKNTLVHNMGVLGISPDNLRAIVLSHGHTDHHGGLASLLQQLGPRRIPLVLHPDAWRDRKVVYPNGSELHLPPPSRADLEQEGIELLENRDPSLLIDDTVLVTGQVRRVTSFERGMPAHYATNDAGWEEDPWIWDDQALIVNVKDKGLVVVSGCSHAGIINILHYAQALTGIQKIYATIGGLHLSGKVFEPIIPPTVDELVRLSPEVIMPGHCTGWKAVHEIARRLPDAYIQTCVGTCLSLAATA